MRRQAEAGDVGGGGSGGGGRPQDREVRDMKPHRCGAWLHASARPQAGAGGGAGEEVWRARTWPANQSPACRQTSTWLLLAAGEGPRGTAAASRRWGLPCSQAARRVIRRLEGRVEVLEWASPSPDGRVLRPHEEASGAGAAGGALNPLHVSGQQSRMVCAISQHAPGAAASRSSSGGPLGP